MKSLPFFLAGLSLSASAFAGWIPPFGVTCEAKNGATVELYPNDDETMVQVVLRNPEGQAIGDNNHKITAIKTIGQVKAYTILGFVEMDQTATFKVREETMKGASFTFNHGAHDDLGLPKVYANCDVQ